jgi:hypothetical protein
LQNCPHLLFPKELDPDKSYCIIHNEYKKYKQR